MSSDTVCACVYVYVFLLNVILGQMENRGPLVGFSLLKIKVLIFNKKGEVRRRKGKKS